MDVRDTPLEPLLHQQYTGMSSATALANIPARARSILMKCTVQAVRWKDDTGKTGATAVDATHGILLDVGDEFFYSGKLSQLRFFEAVAGAILDVAYYA